MQDDPPEDDDVKRYLEKQRELTYRYSQHNAKRSIRNANQPPSYDGSEECIDFDCNPDHSQAAFLPDDVIEPGEVTAPMQEDPTEDDDMFCDENPQEDSLPECLSEDDIADYDFKFDEALYKLYGGNCKTYWIGRTFDKCLFAFIIILLLSLISMILYAYVCWINSMMP